MKPFGLFLLLLLFSVHIAEADALFIFNPEAKTSKIEYVKADLEAYLKSCGINSDIYIFTNPDDFQSSVTRLNPSLAIIASYYYTAMQRVYNWESILSGYNNGAKTFNKVLITPLSVKDPLELKTKSLATVSLGSSSTTYIESQLPSGLSAKDIRIVWVSKDIDAIMALGFKQVQAAIVTRASFDKLNQINPDVGKNLHILQDLTPLEYPKIVIFPTAKHVKKITESFKQMSNETDRKEVLKFFDITEFKPE